MQELQALRSAENAFFSLFGCVVPSAMEYNITDMTNCYWGTRPLASYRCAIDIFRVTRSYPGGRWTEEWSHVSAQRNKGAIYLSPDNRYTLIERTYSANYYVRSNFYLYDNQKRLYDMHPYYQETATIRREFQERYIAERREEATNAAGNQPD